MFLVEMQTSQIFFHFLCCYRLQPKILGTQTLMSVCTLTLITNSRKSAGLLILQCFLYCNTIGNTFSSIASILAILFQKSIANGIANTFVSKILPILSGNTFILLDAMIIVKRFNNILSQLLKAFLCDLRAVNTKVI